MFVILCYDVGAKRISKVRKTVKKYLHAVQKSVFEGHLTQSQLRRLQTELRRCIDPEHDAVTIYIQENTYFVHKASIGVEINNSCDFL